MPIFPTDIQDSYIVTLPLETKKLLEGNVFSTSYYLVSLANNASIDLLVMITEGQFRLMIDGIAAGDALLSIYENPTISNNGTPLELINHNRFSDKIFPGSVFHTPTVNNNGKILVGPIYCAGGIRNKSSGSNAEGCEAILIKPNINYLVRLTNISEVAAKAMLGIHGCFPVL